MKKINSDKHTFELSGKTISVYPACVYDRPVIYLNTFSQEAERVHQALGDMDCGDFTLVTISDLAWNHDMVPWDTAPVFPKDEPFTGGADTYLRLLSEEIIPRAERFVLGQALWRGIAGYSLGGLFAMYSLYHVTLFSRAASMSGSLWFPDFLEYVFSHEMLCTPEHLYLSLGDRECRTKNPFLKTVQERTEQICDFYSKKGIDTAFVLHPGDHFKNAVQRTAAGIAWILERAQG